MINEIPLPIPCSVICSPSHIINITPVTIVTTLVNINKKPGFGTAPSTPDCRNILIPNALKDAINTVPYLVYCAIFFCPSAPSFFNLSKNGITPPKS